MRTLRADVTVRKVPVLYQRNEFFLQAFVGGKYVGFARYRYHRDHYELLDFCVTAEMRGRGIGTALMHSLACRVRSPRYKIRYYCDYRNFSGLRFLSWCGFQITTTEDDTLHLCEYEVSQ